MTSKNYKKFYKKINQKSLTLEELTKQIYFKFEQ